MNGRLITHRKKNICERRHLRFAVLLSCFALVSFFFLRSLPPFYYFEQPRKYLNIKTDRLYHSIATKNGIANFWTFDDFPYRGIYSDHGLFAIGTKRVKGKFGDACFFNGEDDTAIISSTVWSDMTKSMRKLLRYHLHR